MQIKSNFGQPQAFPGDLVGLTLSEPPPVGVQHLELRPGVTALYGPNGVGKTKTLTAFSDLLSRTTYDYETSEPRIPKDAREMSRLLSKARPHLDDLGRPPPDGPDQQHQMSPASVIYRFGALHVKPDRQLDDPRLGEDWARAWDIGEHYNDGVQERLAGYLPPGLDPGAAKYLADEGLLWIADTVKSFGAPMVYICDPKPLEGPLQAAWLEAQSEWNEILRDSPRHEEECLSNYFFYRHERELEGYWEWTFETEHGKTPALPPLPETLGLDSWPDWTGFPVALVGRHAPIFSPTTENGQDLEQLTRERLPPTPEKVQICQDKANQVLEGLFEKPPVLKLDIGKTTDWWRGVGPRWTASSGDGRPQVPIEQLGAAHQRYVHFAIQRSLNAFPFAFELRGETLLGTTPDSAPSFLFVDEPERALHLIAEASLARGLKSFADAVIVSTHSAELIDHADQVVLLKPRGVTLKMESLAIDFSPENVKQEALRLGITPSYLASKIKVLLFVEGEHDEAVIKELLKDEINEARVLIIPMAGTKGVTEVVESNFVLGLSDAKVIVCLDNIGEPHQFENLHTALLKEQTKDKQRESLNVTRDLPRWKSSPEAKVMHSLLTSAQKKNELERINPFGMEKHDIIQYLPVERFVANYDSWDKAFEDFLKYKGRDKAESGDGAHFKAWLRKKRNAKIYTAGIREVAREFAIALTSSADVQQRHPDFNRLAERLRQLAK